MGGRAALGSSSIVPSLPPPCPRSPPTCPDLSGRRREIVKIQLLEREMSLLEGELKLIQGVQLASTCCKEVLDLVDAKSDPLVPIVQKKEEEERKGCRRVWKWICWFSKSPCLFLSWIGGCCCSACGWCLHMKIPPAACCCRCCCRVPRLTCTASCCCSLPKLNCKEEDCLQSCSCCCCCFPCSSIPSLQCPKYTCEFDCPKCSCGIRRPNNCAISGGCCYCANMFDCEKPKCASCTNMCCMCPKCIPPVCSCWCPSSNCTSACNPVNCCCLSF